MKILNGITGLLSSRKGTLSVLITLMVGGLSLAGKVDGTSVAAIIGTVATIYCYTAHKVDIESLRGNNEKA